MVAPMIKRRIVFRVWSHVVLAACIFMVFAAEDAGPVYADLTITPTFDGSITSDPNAAAIEGVINSAIAKYESQFTDPINVTIKFQEMTSGLGQSNTTLYKLNYSDVYNALVADQKSTDDGVAVANLPSGSLNPVTGSSTINVKTANIRALGISGTFTPFGGFDGVIGLNTSITFPPGSGYSLMSVAEHEIDEVLGLGSDLPGTGFFADPAVEDLFRYDDQGNRSYTTSTTATAYFSIDKTTRLAQFDNQNDGGDYGDWQSNPRPSGVQPQVQDAFATPGASPELGVELRALDVIGYDLAPVPEPSRRVALLGLSIMGLSALGVLRLWGAMSA
jgi:hypothetical protein